MTEAPAIPPEPVRRSAMEVARERLAGFPPETVDRLLYSGLFPPIHDRPHGNAFTFAIFV